MNAKKVNIYPRGPVTTTNPPIRGVIKGVTKPIQDIRKCIIAGAKVEEIFEGGKVVLLNLSNYDLDNSQQAKTTSAPPAAAPAINYNAAKGRPRPAFSSPANVAPVEQPVVATPVKEEKASEPVSEPMEEAPVAVDPETTSEEPAQTEEAPESQISQHMTRKQRRAMERAKQAESSSEEPVEVQNPDD